MAEKRRRCSVVLNLCKNKLLKPAVVLSVPVRKQYSLTNHTSLFAFWTEIDILAGDAKNFFLQSFFDEWDNFHSNTDQSANQQNRFTPVLISQESVISDFHKPVRQDVQQKSADKFVC